MIPRDIINIINKLKWNFKKLYNSNIAGQKNKGIKKRGKQKT